MLAEHSWLGVSYNNGTPEGFIHHPFCPLDYCTSKSKYINLINPDEQCKDNHSGLLCGKCEESLSLVLGSYQCVLTITWLSLFHLHWLVYF